MDWQTYILNLVQLVAGVSLGAYIGTKIAQREIKRSIMRCLENRECIEKLLRLLEVLKETEIYKKIEKILNGLEELVT
jgi:DNA mismatch repair ATPase MutS